MRYAGALNKLALVERDRLDRTSAEAEADLTDLTDLTDQRIFRAPTRFASSSTEVRAHGENHELLRTAHVVSLGLRAAAWRPTVGDR